MTTNERVRSLCASVAWSALGAVAITLGAWISVPMAPVPMTLQTLAVVVLGALASRPVALAGVALYVAAALAGLPVLAKFERAPGGAFFDLPTCGYVLGFFAGAFVAREIARVRSWPLQLVWALAAHAVILACGVARLARVIGFDRALEHGLVPFLPGTAVKSALAVVIVRIVLRARARRPAG